MPKLFRVLALEWLWRAMTNPRRLIPRCAASAAILPGQVLAASRLRQQGDAPGLSPDQRVAALRSAIHFEPVASTNAPAFGNASPISALLIIAQSDSGDHAARIANDLTQSILDQTNEDQLGSARETTSFFRAEEARLWQKLEVLDAEIVAYRNANAAALPEVERVLRSHDRKLAQLQSEYEVITARLAEAETAQHPVESQQSGPFSLLERALTPDHPMGSGGRKIAITGTLVSLAAGLALALLIDLLFPVIRTAAQMQRQLSLRPVVAIPVIAMGRSRKTSPLARFIDGPTKPIFDLPRFAVIAAAATLVLLVLSALFG